MSLPTTYELVSTPASPRVHVLHRFRDFGGVPLRVVAARSRADLVGGPLGNRGRRCQRGAWVAEEQGKE